MESGAEINCKLHWRQSRTSLAGALRSRSALWRGVPPLTEISIPERAALNEFGVPSRGQPPRPFFRNMVASKSPEWPDAIGGLLLKNDFDAARALEVAGEAIKAQLQQSITDLTSPALARSTVDRKGFDKPLVEHGDMLNAVEFEVKRT